MKILTAGRFGQAVASQLAAEFQAIEVHPLVEARGRVNEVVNGAEFVAVAAWRPYPDICLELDEACHERGIRWSMAEIHGETLTCGPLIVPGQGPCYHCYRRRYLSHHHAPDRERVIEDAYQRDDDLGPAGFVQPMVAIATGSIAAHARATDAGAGQMARVDIITASVLETEVIAVHECPRCRGGASDDTGSRFVDHLIPQVEGLMR